MLRSLIAVFISGASCLAQLPSATLQWPDVSELPDVTSALQRQIADNGGNLLLSGAKIYRITSPLVFDLTVHDAVSIRSQIAATIVMDGPGPAIRVVGSHEGTASPKSFKPATWRQRMPIISGLEILGNHPEADGIELVQTVEPTISQVAVRWCRHGIHLVTRNRNVTISDCHLYENSGVGIFLDDVNLHQINVSNSHISYNRSGGIVVRDGNVRNLQVSGCDIEGNMPDDESVTTAANVLIDVSQSADDKSRSVAEVSITGCTIQHAANYSGAEDKTVAPGGANIRLAGKAIYPIDSVTVSGNVLSDTTTNIDIQYAQDIVISANNFFAPKPNNLRVRHSARVVVTGNTFNPRQFARPGTILFKQSADCIIANNSLHKFATNSGALILNECSGFTISGLNVSDCESGIVVQRCSDISVNNCRFTRLPEGVPAVSVDAESIAIEQTANAITAHRSDNSSR